MLLMFVLKTGTGTVPATGRRIKFAAIVGVSLMPKPTSAEQWAVACLLAGHVPQTDAPTREYLCVDCARAYARQRVGEERGWWMKMLDDDFPCVAAGRPRGSCKHDSWGACLADAATLHIMPVEGS